MGRTAGSIEKDEGRFRRGQRGLRRWLSFLLVQAELFTSELEQAAELLRSGYKASAAVVSGIVLETTLRELCTRHQLPPGKRDKMNADLAKAGI